MKLGYNTNGFAHHHLNDAVELIAELGYEAIALTVDVHHLNPFQQPLAEYHAEIDAFAARLAKRKLACVIETGARFLLDRKRKHQPTLLDPDTAARQVRQRFLLGSIDLAARLGNAPVSFWSGTPDPTRSEPYPVLLRRLADECKQLADYAAARQVQLAFEPEPGMLIETMQQFAELERLVNHPAFGLTIDVGHLVCVGDLPVQNHVQAWRAKLWNLHLDDMKPNVHDHLLFGEGEVPFAELFAALAAISYQGVAAVELSRHSHDAVRTAAKSMEFLRAWLG